MKAFLAAVLLAMTVALPVNAASYSISLDQADPHFGDYVTFTVSGVPTPKIKNPRIVVNCYQNSELVFGMGGAIDYAFQLGGAGSIWAYERPNTPADCTATLFYFDNHGRRQQFVPLAEAGFHVEG